MDKPATGEAASPPAAIDEAALAAYGCDVAFVSDESTPANLLFAEALECVPDPALAPVLSAAYDTVRAVYDNDAAATGTGRGTIIAHPARLRAIVRAAAKSNGVDPASHSLLLLLPFFDRINRVLFQHQTLAWLLGGDFQVRLYGRGWQNHPQFAPWARGPVESANVRRAIWQASRINLAASPFGAANDDMLGGVACGAFYLMRFCPADVIERFYPPVAEFCRANGITTTAELRQRAPRAMRRLVGFASRTLRMNVLSDWDDFVPHLLEVTNAEHARVRSAAAIFSSYSEVCFSSRDELLALCTRYLYDVPQRKRVAEDLRHQLTEASARVTVTVNKELLERLAASSEVAA
jgi:hypothetical protein